MATDIRTKLTSTIVLDGKEYTLSELSDKAMAALDQYAKRCVYNSMAVGIEELPEHLQDRIVAQATREAAITTFMSATGAQHLGTVDGITELLYQMINPNHSDMTRSQLKKHMFNAAKVDEVNQEFERLNLDPIRAILHGEQGVSNGKKLRRKQKQKLKNKLRSKENSKG